MIRKIFIVSLFSSLMLLFIIDCKKENIKNEEITVKDIDGNVYNTVKIGTQTWMKENLKTTKYRDGSAIPNIIDDSAWLTQTAGTYCWYNNDIDNKAIYGALYNWYAVVDSHKLCPAGWHIPTDTEWTTLLTYLGGSIIAGDKLKDTTLWDSFSNNADNSSGFTALPGGYRANGPNSFTNFVYEGDWWTITEYDAECAFGYLLIFSTPQVPRVSYYKYTGFSVRCVKD
jgi:uncharacterized protein (TIGR02145 family)